MTRETHHKRCTTSHLFSNVVSPTFAPPPPLCFVVGSFVYVTMPLSAQSSSSSVARDVLWARVFGALPDEPRTALCSAGLDDPRVLCEYPVESLQNVEEITGGKFETGGVPSGATSSGQRPSSSPNSTSTSLSRAGSASAGTAMASLVGNVDSGVDSTKGTDPKTGLSPFVPSGGEVKTDHKGGDPRTGLFVPSGGEVKTDQFVPSGGEVKTDHDPFDVQMACLVDETVDSPLPGGLATQTAIPDPVSPALVPVLAVSRGFDHEVSDGFPGIEQDPGFRDGLPSSEQDPKVRDEFPSIGDLQGQAHSEGLNSTSDIENTAISCISRIAEKSERLRESDFGVQIVPASRSPSELGARQMGLSLAGTSRLKDEPIDSVSTLATELSISDRALLRKYKSSDQLQGIAR